MSQLFSKSAIKSAIAGIHDYDIASAISVVQELYDDHKRGNTKDETRYEQSFNELMFHKVLGYEAKVNLHPKASTPIGSKIADVGLGFFDDGLYTPEAVKVVVELKGSTTLLDKKQASYGGQSPVDQGFGYKTSFKDCPWLIVSNFWEIRLYRDNKQDYELRTLETLLDPTNDYLILRKFLALMHKDRLISKQGTSRTEELLSHVRTTQEKITKDFYKQYKQLRVELIKDMQKNNTTISVTTIVEKAQKIIDRIIFIHFCEDRGLLPEGKLQTNIMRAYEADFTPWEVLKKYFQGVDAGSEKLGIPEGYNGGLFHDDSMLNSLLVSDAICKKFIDLGQYNFDDELSVNILGHIFEQSISDLEEIKSSLFEEKGKTNQAQAAKSSKRKKDGIFYTPEYIVDYIVQNSLMTYLEEKEKECLDKIGKKGGYKTELEAYQAYQHILQNVKVLDPACGSGAFLVKVFDYLFAENKRVGDIVGGLFTTDEMYKGILRNNIYGVDLNPESVEITKLSLWLKSAQKGKKLNNLDDNIKCGNSLIDDPAVAGDKAFDWQKEFADIMGAGGFDVIVGNPPYGAKLDENSLNFCKSTYESVSGHMEIYYVFVEKSIKILKPYGSLSFIIPNSWLTNKYAFGMRKYLFQTGGLTSLINFYEKKIFEEAQIETMIFVYNKDRKETSIMIGKDTDSLFYYDYKERLNKEDLFINIPQNKTVESIIEKMHRNVSKFDDFFDITLGYKPYQVGYGKNLDDKPMTKENVEKKIYHSDVKINDEWKEEVRGKDMGRYEIKGFSEYVKRGSWLMSPKDIKYYTSTKILVRQITGRYLSSVLHDGELYVDQTLNIIILKDQQKTSLLHYALALINSRLYGFYFQNYYGEQAQLFPKIKVHELKKLPIKNIPLTDQTPFIAKADLMLSLNKELHEKVDFVLRFLQSKFGIEKLSTKLQKFYEHDFTIFLKELKAKKLSMNEESELMEFFDSKKKEIFELKGRIDATDREIDEMVYSLYGLTEEEKMVVEGV